MSLEINITLEFLKEYLKVVLNTFIATIVLIFAIQIPRLEKFKDDKEKQTEIKKDWGKFLQRFVLLIIFILVTFLSLEFFIFGFLKDFVLAVTIVGLFYLFKSIFSYLRNI
ncbi:MAG: hypothetical protein WCT08_02510 [Patescibacteria group bacterium]